MLVDIKVRDFIADLASDSPAPGGGSVAAISGALAAALLSMVCRLTIGKKGYETVQSDIESALEKSDELYKTLVSLVDEDINVFNALMATFKLPKQTAEEKEKRTAIIQTAFKKAADVPLNIAVNCEQVLILAESLVNKVNTNAISDVGVAALSAYSGLEAAVMNVKINLSSIKDQDYVNSIKQEIIKLLKEGQEKKDNTYNAVMKLMEAE